MSQTPYSGGDPSPWLAAPVDTAPTSGGVKTLLIVLLVLAIAVFGLIIAACGVAYFGIQQAIQPELQVVLPDRGQQADNDASVLAASMQQPAAPVHPEDREIRRWFATQFDRAQQAQSIAPQADLFFAAVMGSPEGDELNLLQQFQLRVSVDAAVPEPATSANYTILDIAADSAPDTARVAVVFYDPNSLANLQTWYLVKEKKQWELYDWFEADAGRRKSDEYAHYCRHTFDDHTDGYDEVEQLVFDATEANLAGDVSEARDLLEQAERIQTLPYDRDRGLLSIGRGYQHLGDEARAAKVFGSATQPAAVPGIWASLGISQLAIEKPEAALQSADQLRKVYPHHPAAELVSAHAYERLNQNSEAAEHYLRCLAMCPNDSTVLSWLIHAAEPGNAAEIVKTIRRSEQAETFLLQLFGGIESNTDMLAAVDAAMAEMEDAPGIWKVMSEVALRRAQGDISGALKRLNEAIPPMQQAAVEKAAVEKAATESAEADAPDGLRDQLERWLVQWSFDSGELSELRQREDFARLTQQTAEELFADEYYPDTTALETSLAALPDTERKLPSVVAMRGWSAWQEDRYADAVIHFSAWLDMQPKPSADAPTADLETADLETADEYLRDEVPWYLCNSLASLGRFEEAFVRFGDDRALCWDAVQMLIQRRDRESAQNIRERIAASDTPAAEMVCAAIDASLAAWEGSAEEADRSWIACLKSFGDLDPDSYSRELYAFGSVARRRGETAIRLRHVLPLLADRSVPGWEPTVQEICSRTAELFDSQLAGIISVSLLGTHAHSEATKSQPGIASAVWEMNAEIAELQHDWETAVALRRNLLRATEAENWEMPGRRRALANTLLHSAEALAGDELSGLLESLADDSLWASYYAARGMDAEVREALSKLDSAERGQWYASPVNRPYVLHNQALAEWLSQSDAPLCIASTSPLESMLLVEDQPRTLTATEVGEAVAAFLGPEASVTQVTTALAPGVETRWAIRLPDSVDVLVTAGRGKLVSNGILPATAAEAIAEGHGYIAIDVIRSDRPGYRVSLPLAARLASAKTRLCYDANSGYLWYESDSPWSERLAFGEKLPVDTHSIDVDYLYLDAASTTASEDPQNMPDEPSEAEETTAGEMLDAEWLRAKLAAGDGGYPVLLQISAGNAAEQIPAIATAVDANSWLVDLELQENSSVLTALQKGQRVRANTYHLIHP